MSTQDLLLVQQETLKAVQGALAASQQEAHALTALVAELRRIVTDQREQLEARADYIAVQDQLIRFQANHVPASLVYPAPFDAMMKARSAN